MCVCVCVFICSAAGDSMMDEERVISLMLGAHSESMGVCMCEQEEIEGEGQYNFNYNCKSVWSSQSCWPCKC